MHLSFLIRPAVFLLLVLGLLGCGKADLSRSSAKDMIQGSQELRGLSQNLPLNSAAGGKTRVLDILNRNGALTPNGLKLFSTFDYSVATLAQPVSPPNVEITGIAAVPMVEDMKEVHFDVALLRLPPEVKRFAANGGKGVAHFRRYDDGWRLEKVKLSMSREPYPLTPQEQSDEQAEIAAGLAEWAKRSADLQKLVDQSRIPENKILEFAEGGIFFVRAGQLLGGVVQVNSLVLYDTEVSVYFIAESIQFWFGDNTYVDQNQCATQPPGGYLTIESYKLSLTSNAYADRLIFSKKEECLEFKQKFEESLQNWRNTYATAFSALAELQ